MEKQKTQSAQKNKKASKDIAKYSGLAFQMITIILIGVVGGIKLDQWIKSIEFPIFTVVLSISSVVFATYYAIKDFLK